MEDPNLLKYVYYAVIGGIVGACSWFIKKVWAQQEQADKRIDDAHVRLSVLESRMSTTQEDIREIKKDLKALSNLIREDLAKILEKL